MLLLWLLAALPILLIAFLILGLGWSASRAGPAGWLAAAAVAWLGFGAGTQVLAVSQAKAFFLALDVLLIVWAAYALYRVVDEGGGVAALAQAIPGLTSDRGSQALLIGWAFASFLQGVGGFGVPVVVTAPILVGLGFDPVTAVVVPSLGHAWSVTFGSLGSSFQALTTASGLATTALAAPSAVLLGLLCFASGATALLAAGERVRPLHVGIMGSAMAATQVALAVGGVWHIAGFGGGLVGLAVGYLLVRRDGRQRSGATVPARRLALAVVGYLLLVVVTFTVQFLPPLRSALGSVVLQAAFPAVETGGGFVTSAESGKALVLLRHAGAILLYTSALAYAVLRLAGATSPGALRRIASDTGRGVLGSSLAIASMTGMVAIMSHAGMTDVLARGLARAAGQAFPLMAPWIGALGAFVSGSNTSSNLLFGLLQRRTAEVLGLAAAWVLAGQTAGGALGSVLSPTKVSVGAAAASAGEFEGRILRRLLRYAVPLLLILGVLTWLSLKAAGG